MSKHSSPAHAGFTLIEILIVVSIIGLLLAIAVPNFLKSRELSRAKSCIANLRQIDTAKQQYMLDKNSSSFTNANSSDTTLGGLAPSYIRFSPACPVGGTYNTGDSASSPSCSLATTSAALYGQTGSYPHYLP